jgi:hypothetical protein
VTSGKWQYFFWRQEQKQRLFLEVPVDYPEKSGNFSRDSQPPNALESRGLRDHEFLFTYKNFVEMKKLN